MKIKFWKTRFVILLVLFELRLLGAQIEGLQVREGEKVRVTGNVIKITQSISNCKVGLNNFWFEIEGRCRFSQGDRIRIIGITQRGVIEMFFGEMRLRSALIDDLNIQEGIANKSNQITDFFKGFREKIRYKYREILPFFESGLVAGMVTGDKEGLSDRAYDLMVNSGTIHIIVASGYNVMLVAGAVMSALLWVCRRSRAVLITLLSVVIYTLLSGGDPPVVRAAVMAGVLLVGEALGRRSVSWWSLLLAGWAMVMIEPLVLKSASFQLSMAASVGLMVVYPAVMSMFDIEKNRLIGVLDKTGIMTTLSTMLTTTPIIWWHFHRISLIGLVSNILVLPMISVIMILGVLALLFGSLVAPFLYAATHWVVVIIEYFGKG